jgi:hypothetical protein
LLVGRTIGGVRVGGLRFSPRNVLIVALMVVVVISVMFGIDLINGRWDQPAIEFQPPL